ncbi:hypothetical protein W822_21345 [Advenella kashmirensis W13003]|uniref:Uncharacterized protein n=1 Tax=Advenella kashmirensis W13003 TaxID=1424334 RepID=V8QNT1_9BURK|nr:hypothetical protein W822_21345 [Advenella kashmirensis W13003]
MEEAQSGVFVFGDEFNLALVIDVAADDDRDHHRIYFIYFSFLNDT